MRSTVKQTIVYDENTGEVLVDKSTKGSPNGQGWVIMYSEKIFELLPELSGSVARVFLYLAAGQQFEERGVITTKKAVQEALGMTKKTCLDAFKWLKEHHVITENLISGHTEFMVNPDYVTIGRDKRKRYKEWVLRLGANPLSTSSKVRSVHRVASASSSLPPSGRSIEIE
jgi:hypothetical protein